MRNIHEEDGHTAPEFLLGQHHVLLGLVFHLAVYRDNSKRGARSADNTVYEVYHEAAHHDSVHVNVSGVPLPLSA